MGIYALSWLFLGGMFIVPNILVALFGLKLIKDKRIEEIKILLAVMIVIQVSLFAWALFNQQNNTSSFKCPDDYETSEERTTAFEGFSDDYYDNNPNASTEEFLEARKQFWIDNNCKEALARYDDYMAGRADPRAVELIEEAMDEVLNNRQYYTNDEYGISFAVSEGFYALSDAKEGGLILVVTEEYARRLVDNPDDDVPLDAVVISVVETSPDYPALSWLESPSSEYNIENSYRETEIGGVEAYLLDWSGDRYPDGALFDNPEKTLRFSVTTFGSSPSEEISAEFENVVNSFHFDK